MAPPPQYLTGHPAEIEDFLDRFDTFLFDCDGVLWSGEQTFARVPETIAMLKNRGKRLVFVTNNSTKSRADYKLKFDQMGIEAHEDEIFGSSYSAAVYIARVLRLTPPNNKVFVLGESGVEHELAAAGIPHVGGTDPSLRRAPSPADLAALAAADPALLDPHVAVVLTALDFHPSYLKYAVAHAHLRRGATFLATNTDSTLPTAGSLFPGAGALSAPLVVAGGRAPLALGKPAPAMMDAIEGRVRFARARACMVGDRLDTDVRFGVEAGLGGTLCVLTGVSAKEEFLRDGADLVPSAYVDCLADLLG